MACCLSRGLCLTDIDRLNIGVLINYIHAYDKINFGDRDTDNSQKDNFKKATQADFDAF